MVDLFTAKPWYFSSSIEHIYCDNMSTIHIATNPIFHEQTKHIEMDHHIMRDKIQSKTINLIPISLESQMAYLFTKPLHLGPYFDCIVSKIGMLNIHSSLRRDVKT